MASAFPTSAIMPLLERNILECLPVIHKRLHKCLVIPFRPHLEPVRWTLPSLRFRKTWFREGETYPDKKHRDGYPVPLFVMSPDFDELLGSLHQIAL